MSATVGGTNWTDANAGDGRRLSVTSGGTTAGYTWDVNFDLPQLALETTGASTLRYTYGLDLISLHAGTRWTGY